jgi:hypothetical protein
MAGLGIVVFDVKSKKSLSLFSNAGEELTC